MDKFGNYLKWDEVEHILLEKRFSYFRRLDLDRLFPSHVSAIPKLLNRKVREGKIIRLKRTLYCLARKVPSELVIANVLYQPSYVSLETALSYYSIIPETVYTITSVTTKPTREFVATNRTFSYHTIKHEAFCGYIPKRVDQQTVLIALPEKALADYLYFVNLGKKGFNDRTDWSKVDVNRVKEYLTKQYAAPSAHRLLP